MPEPLRVSMHVLFGYFAGSFLCYLSSINYVRAFFTSSYNFVPLILHCKPIVELYERHELYDFMNFKPIVELNFTVFESIIHPHLSLRNAYSKSSILYVEMRDFIYPQICWCFHKSDSFFCCLSFNIQRGSIGIWFLLPATIFLALPSWLHNESFLWLWSFMSLRKRLLVNTLT